LYFFKLSEPVSQPV